MAKPSDDTKKEQLPVDDVPWEDRPWSESEIKELLQSHPKTLGEIALSPEVGAWADLGIEDSQAWVDAVRRQEAERRVGLRTSRKRRNEYVY